MYDMSKFIKYLNKSDDLTPTTELGLVENAPQSAIDAYEQYKKQEEERLNSKDFWE
jgi:hypothetical protein